MFIQPSAGMSSSEVLSRNEPRVFLRTLKGVSTCFFFFKDSSSLAILSVQAFSCSDIRLLSFFPDMTSTHQKILVYSISRRSKGVLLC
ncbi:unnamed protein product [Prunus brigantina]